MASQKILIPYNFTQYDQVALDFAARTFLHQPDCYVALFNVHTPAPTVGMREDPVMLKMKDNLNYLMQRVTEQETQLRQARVDLIKKGFAETQVGCIFEPKKKDVAVHIIETAQQGGFDTIILSYKAGKVKHFFTGNVYNKVISGLRDRVVCVVS